MSGIGEEKESISLAYNAVIISKGMEGVSFEVNAIDLNNEFQYESIEAIATDDSDNIIVTFEKSGNTYSISKNGEIGEYNPPQFAKDKVILNIDENGKIEDEYYMNYPSSKLSNSIKCLVLYNDDVNGLQISAVDPVRSVKLGDEDSKVTGSGMTKAVNSYNRICRRVFANKRWK